MGNNFTYNTAGITLSAALVKTLSKAAGRDADGFPVAQSAITVDEGDLAALIAAQRAGSAAVYGVGLILDGASCRITVTLIKDTPLPVTPPPVTPPSVTPPPSAAVAPTEPVPEPAVTISTIERVVTRVTEVTNRIADELNESVSAAGEGLADIINDISEDATPRSAGEIEGAWALINLLLAALGVFLFLGAFLFSPGRVKIDGGRNARRRNPAWRIASLIAAAAGMLLFLFTEDLSAPMRMTDGYTPVHAIIVFVCLIGTCFCLRADPARADMRGDMEVRIAEGGPVGGK
jgi:hypothetical protein